MAIEFGRHRSRDLGEIYQKNVFPELKTLKNGIKNASSAKNYFFKLALPADFFNRL